LEEGCGMAEFHELLAELRMDRKMEQKDLAEVFHVSASTISNYERGAALPPVERLCEFADYFQVTTDYLLGRCQSDLSPDVFQEQILEDRTAGELLELIRRLPADRKAALSLILSDMEFHSAVTEYRGKKKRGS